jgi:4-hydroxybenzoate polyprenyltransferase
MYGRFNTDAMWFLVAGCLWAFAIELRFDIAHRIKDANAGFVTIPTYFGRKFSVWLCRGANAVYVGVIAIVSPPLAVFRASMIMGMEVHLYVGMLLDEGLSFIFVSCLCLWPFIDSVALRTRQYA